MKAEPDFDLLWSYRIYPLDVQPTGVDYVLRTSEALEAIKRVKDRMEVQNLYLMLDHHEKEIDYDKTIGFIRRFFIAKGYLCVDIFPMSWEMNPIWQTPPDSFNIQLVGDVDLEDNNLDLVDVEIYHLNVDSNPSALKHSRFLKFRRWYYPSTFIGPVHH